MTMHCPPHPGRLLRRRIVPALNMSLTDFSRHMGMSRTTISRVLNERAGISPDFAVRLEHAGISNARHWLTMQDNFNRWHARQRPQNHIARIV